MPTLREFMSGTIKKTTSSPAYMFDRPKAPTSTAPVQQELKQRRLSQKASAINTGKTGEPPKETLLQKAERLGIKPQNEPQKETLLQKAQRLGMKPSNGLSEREQGDIEHTEVYKPTFPIKAGEESLISAPLKGLGNIPASGFQLGKGLLSAVSHPAETARGLANIAGGLIGKGVQSGAEALGIKTKPIEEQSKSSQEARQTANAVLDMYKQRYGSLDAVQRTVGNDPVGFALDILMVAEGAAAKVGKTKQLNQFLSTTGKTGAKAIGKVIKPITKAPAEFITGVSGKLTGKGQQALKQALSPTDEFFNAMRGKTSGEEIVKTARKGLEKIKGQRSKEYVSAIDDISLKNKKALDISPIKGKFDELLGKYGIKKTTEGLDFSRSPLSDKSKQIEAMANNIDDWGAIQGDRSIKGVDLLKRRIRTFKGTDPTLNSFVDELHSSARNVLGEVPEYSKVMKRYGDYTDFIDELKANFGVGRKLSDDQVLTKIKQTLSDNKQYRRQLANEFSKMTGKDLTQMIAGYQLKPFTPSGIGGYVTTGSGIGLGVSGNMPALIGTLIGSSPRVMGEILGVIGVSNNKIKQITNAIGNIKATSVPKLNILEKLQRPNNQ